jgi:hypothetical protein
MIGPGGVKGDEQDIQSERIRQLDPFPPGADDKKIKEQAGDCDRSGDSPDPPDPSPATAGGQTSGLAGILFFCSRASVRPGPT